MSPPSETSPRALIVMFVMVVIAALGIMMLSWNASLLDRYEFRQIQTALSTFWIVQEGWQMDYFLPLFGPPWSVPMEFPTYQIIVAQLHQITGFPLEQSGRLVGIVFLIATLPALYELLAISRLPRSRRLIVLTLVLTSPMYLFYARAFMIETTALCFSVWFLALYRRALLKPHLAVTAAAAILGVLAALTKITTFIVFGIPAVSLAIATFFASAKNPLSPSVKARPVILSFFLAALSLGVTWLWVRHGDEVKHSNPFTGFLTSGELHNWNYGPLSLRFDWSFWVKVQENIAGYVLAEGALAVALLCVPFASRRICIISGVAVAGFISGPLIFANLYHAHDYYYSANALLLVGAAGLLIASIWDDHRLPRGTNWLALSLILIFQGYAFYRGYYSHHRNPAPPPPALAEIIRNSVPAEGVVLIYGADWNPLLPYYFQRRTIMVPGERENETQVLEDVLANLPPSSISAMVVHGKRLLANTDFIKDRTRRFGFASQPYARSGNDELYLPSSVSPVAHNADRSVELLKLPAVDLFSKKLKIDDLTDLDLSIFSPTPESILSGYGVNSFQIEGQTIINAHAPSELVFNLPAGARNVEAVFGLPDAAYASGSPAVTDGITIDIIAHFLSGRRQRLYQRTLNPAQNQQDRGPQEIKLELPDTFTGKIIFQLGNGPQNDPTNDWAYWTSIQIR